MLDSDIGRITNALLIETQWKITQENKKNEYPEHGSIDEFLYSGWITAGSKGGRRD
jgi:hypothetical protein